MQEENEGSEDGGQLLDSAESSEDAEFADEGHHTRHRFAAAAGDETKKDNTGTSADKPKDSGKPVDDKKADSKPESPKPSAGASDKGANPNPPADDKNKWKVSEPAYQPPCDLTTDRGICLFGGQRVLLPDNTPKVCDNLVLTKSA